MGRALVVYESMFGNSELIARAVAEGVAEVLPVDLVDVTHAPRDLEGYAVLVAGGPTHAFTMSRDTTRREAREQGATHGCVGEGLREWLAALPQQGRHPWFASFDTRVTRRRHLPASAARSAARSARRHGLREVASPESFFVEDVDGPLVAGELERARHWGLDVASAVPAAA
jgi:hypothetical protein